MSNDFLKAADAAKLLLRGFKGFEEVAAALELAGIAEQSKTEALRDLELLRDQVALEKSQLAILQADCVSAKAKANNLIDQANQKAAELLEHAQKKAIDDAEKIRQEADVYLKTKTLEVDALVNQQRNAESCIEGLLVKIKDLEERASNARAYLAKLAS